MEHSLVTAFEAQVAARPHRLALTTERTELTYGALDALANGVAGLVLEALGPGPEPVALCLGSESAMIAAMLGVLKAGKAYVPVDPRLPPGRAAFILEDCRARLVVTDGPSEQLASVLARGQRVLRLSHRETARRPSHPMVPRSPGELAWILYTSGSTGRPKGVVQTDRNVLHYVTVYSKGLHISGEDRVALILSLAVNGAAHEMWSALLNGASLHVLDVGRAGVGRLPGWLEECRITMCTMVPTLYRQLLDALDGRARFPSLRVLKLIGEPVSCRDVARYKTHFSDGCVLVNRLGATETGTIRWYIMGKDTELPDGIVPVGHAVEDNDILLLGEDGQEVPPGCVGEIAVRSRYLTPGYWHRPDLTQAAFVRGADGARMFRSGDLGRLLPDGRLLCLGRRDSQVKIRGHRVEIIEVETALLALREVQEAVVVARVDGAGAPRLIAHVVPRRSHAPTVTALRRRLSERLPAHMIPSAFILHRTLPLAPNGKVDRSALPAPGDARPNLDTPLVAPRTLVERRVATLWSELLSITTVGIDDDLFALGGDSLLAMRILVRLESELAVALPLDTFLENPTIRALAACIVAAQLQVATPADRDHLLEESGRRRDTAAEPRRGTEAAG